MAVVAEATVFNEYSHLGISDINDFGSAILHGCLITELEERNLWADPEVQWSYQFAMDLHKDERRADGSYIDHLARVGLWVVRGFSSNDPEAVKAAFLHDAVENHPKDIIRELGVGSGLPGTIYEQALDALDSSGRIADRHTNAAISALTCPSFVGLEPATKRRDYARHIVGVTLKNPLAALVKIADRIDNANGNRFNPDPKMQRRLDWKYYPLHGTFVDAVTSEESLIPASRQERVVAKLERGHREARDRLLRSLPMIPGMSEDEVDGLTLENVLGQDDAIT